MDLIQKEFEYYGFIDTFEKLRLKFLFICESECEEFINLFMISDALNILYRKKYVDFSFEDLTFAIEQAEKDVMNYEDYQRMNLNK